MSAYWPWWAGAIALGSLTAVHLKVFRQPLGVSGSWRRVVEAATDPAVRSGEAAMTGDDDAALEAALLEATERAFGADAMRSAESASDGAPTTPTAEMALETPWTAHALFLVMLIAGAVIAGITSGGLHVAIQPALAYEQLLGRGPFTWIALAIGGVCVGFGTRMAGGCSSGHGLSGCARLERTSLIATAAFFGTGCAASLLIARFLS